MKRQIFITMDGGLLDSIDVTKDLEDVKITVVDFDIEGSMMEVKETPAGEEALIYEHETNAIEDVTFWEKIKEKADAL